MATHSIRYFGRFDLNFHSLRSDTELYIKSDGGEGKPDAGDTVDGIRFCYMQRGAEMFFLVRVDDFVLRAPVLLIPERHMDEKKFSPNPKGPTTFGDDSAMRLLIDAAIANPEFRDILGDKIRGLGPTSSE